MRIEGYPVVEIFQSIQGEGINIGTPCTFIRFAGCNLKCPWCDTDWSVPKLGFLTAEQIVEKIDFKLPLIVFTGGEPFLQDLKKIVKLIRDVDADIAIAVETNGTLSTMQLDEFDGVWITCSPKPQSKWDINPLCRFDELKYVIDKFITDDKIRFDCPFVWLQPEGGEMQESWKRCFAIAMRYPQNVRVGVQLHKIMEVK